MKKLSIAALLMLGLAFVGFKTLSDHATAKVNQMQGLFIFVDSTPGAEYDYLGSVQNKMSLSGNVQYSEVRDRLIKAAKKEYPTADGLILHFQTGAADKADCIKFKE